MYLFGLAPLDVLGLLFLVLGIVVMVFSATPLVPSKMRILVVMGGMILIVVGLITPAFIPAAPVTQNITNQTVAVQNLVATSTNTSVDSGNPYQIDVLATISTAGVVSFPAGGVVTFHFDMVRTDTNTSKAIFMVTNNNVQVSNNTAGYVASYNGNLIKTYSNGSEALTVYGYANGQTAYVPVPAASVVQVNVSATLSSQAMANLYNDGNGLYHSFTIPDLIVVAGHDIGLQVTIVKA